MEETLIVIAVLTFVMNIIMVIALFMIQSSSASIRFFLSSRVSDVLTALGYDDRTYKCGKCGKTYKHKLPKCPHCGDEKSYYSEKV